MEKVLKLYTYIDGIQDAPFPNEEQQVIISDFRSEYNRMGTAPTISCTIMHHLCLDKLWNDKVYATFNGERFFIKQTPTSSFNNTDARYKHEVELVSERIILDSVYVYDVVTKENDYDKPISNSSKFVFFGNIHEFAERLNYSLEYRKLDYRVVVDDGITSDGKLISFEDQYFSSALQEIYNTYEIPYYFVGKTIHVGYSENQIEHIFKYGVDESLLSIQKQNSNSKIVNRITGVGSSDNIPFYYPNNSEIGELDYTIKNKEGKDVTKDFFVKNYNTLAKGVKVGTTYTYYDTTNYVDMEVLGAYFCKKEGDSPTTAWERISYGDDHVAFNTYINIKTYGGVVVPTFHHYRIDFKIKAEATVNLTFKAGVTTPTQDGSQFFFDLSDARFVRLFKGEYSPTNYAIRTIKTSGDNISFHLQEPDVYSLEIFDIDVTKIYPTLTNASYAPIFFNVKKISSEKRTSEWRNESGHKIDDLARVGLSGNENELEFGSTLSTKVLYRVAPQPNLMPSIYRESKGDERFYDAINGLYIEPESGNYYNFENPYIVGKPKEHIENFEDIKPSIVGITNANGERIDMFIEFAYDNNDNDELDEDGKYKHPYLFGKLRKFDGEFGFNLFDHAIDENEMVVAMTSGSCGACEFIIGVDNESQKNLVQVGENGELLRDSDGNVRCGREGMQKETPQPHQNDTKNNEVWVALKKDINTFGIVMPNATNNYKPSTNDTFVILHIEMPKAYVLYAEDKLKDELIKYMAIKNREKFDFSISFSRVFFAENPQILSKLNENSLIRVEYDGELYDLYVSSYSYSMTNDKPLPEVKIELSKDVKLNESLIKNLTDKFVNDLLTAEEKQNQIINLKFTNYLRTDVESSVSANVKFEQGLSVANTRVSSVVTTQNIEESTDEKIYSAAATDEKIKNALENASVSGDFLSKTKEDVAQKKIVFKEGVGIGNAVILWDEEQGGLHIQKFDGTPAGLWTDSYLSAKGANPNGGGSSEDGATTLGGLRNVAADADRTYDVAKMLVLEANSNLWTLKNLSELVGGLDEAELDEYLTKNNYAKKSDIPSLSGYATEQWVLGKGYATTSDLDARIDALVNGAPQAYDTLKEIADVLANNINSIDDILTALGTKVSKDDFNTAIANVNTAIDSLNTELGLKLDAVTFNELFEKVTLEGGVTAIRAKYGLFTDYFLSAKGANTNGGTTPSGNQYTRLDTWDGYTTAMDGWVLSAKLGKGLYDTQNSLISRIGALEGKATNVSFTQSLTSGTQIGSISIDGVTKNIYAPTIPTSDINKGVTAYGWGNHASAGYAMASALGGYFPKSGGTINGNIIVSNSNGIIGIEYTQSNSKGYLIYQGGTNWRVSDNGWANSYYIIHSGNYTDYIYSKSTIDTKLGGYLPLSGGTLTNTLTIQRNPSVICFTSSSGSLLGFLGFGDANTPIMYENDGATLHTFIHSGNIGSQSVDNADKVDGYHVKATDTPFGGIPVVRADGVMEIGKYIDFHNDNTSGNDYDCRLDIQGGNGNIVHLPSTSGTLALLTDNVASASNINNTSPILVSANESDEIKGIVYPSVTTTKGLNNNYAVVHNGLDFRWYNSHWLIANNRSSDVQSNGFGFWFSDSANTYTMKAMISNDGIIYSSGGFSGGLYGNATSATKLQTARSIWGQNFDGTGNVNGSIIIEKMQNSYDGSPIQISANTNNVKLGYRILNCHYSNLLEGSSLLLYFGVAESKYNAGYLKYDYRGSSNNLNALSLGFYDADDLMCILASGNVGIGTINPTVNLHIYSTSSSFSPMLLIEKGGAYDVRLELSNAADKLRIIQQASGNAYISLNGNHPMIFETSNTERMRIEGNGNVGIGTTNPQYKLDVNGALNAGIYYASTTDSVGKNTSGHFRFGKFDEVGGLKLQFGAESGTKFEILNSAWNKALFVVDTEGNVTASGTIHSNIGIFSDGYVSAKGQNTSSDMRLKNVLNDVVLGVNDIANAPSVRFSWKNGGGVDVGSSAQYWQVLLPDAVKERDGMLEMQYANIALLSAIAIAKNVETHEERIARLERESEELKNEINSLRYGA